MTSQPLDLGRSLHILRKHLAWVGILMAAGLLGGIGYVQLDPPVLTSNMLVAIPTSTNDASSQLVIATSEPVLALAGERVSPAMTAKALAGQVQVNGLTPYLLLISGQGRTAAQAESVAKAVADSYIRYLGSPAGADGVHAKILDGPTVATGMGLPLDMLVTGVTGVLAGALIGVIVVLAIGRKDQRLQDRDQIADAIGVPVLASVPVRRPADTASWSRLLQDYQPSAAEARQFRSVLKHLTASNVAGVGRPAAALTVVSLLSDRRALVLGPLLAAFAASSGISTALVVAPQHDTGSAEALLAACAAQPSRSGSSGQLRVVMADHDGSYSPPETAVTVVVAVIDSQAPRAVDTIRTTPTMLGVSAGAATSEELAQVAAVITAGGRTLAGLLIADPNPADETTGRVPQLSRPAQKTRPTRLTGIAARG